VMKKRNPIAKLIRDPRFNSRSVKSKKVYTRKGRQKEFVAGYKKGLGQYDPAPFYLATI
jgi:hypothetical protein